MTIKWSFSYNYFVILSFKTPYSYYMDPYHSITKDHKGTAIFLETTHIKAGFAQA